LEAFIELDFIGQRLVGGKSLTITLVLQSQGCLLGQGISPVLNTGSTNANLPLSQGLLVVTIGASTHTVHGNFMTGSLENGFEQLLEFVQKVGNKRGNRRGK
jgi:hypothetical protein